jgi:predicted acetyltransferase
VTQGTFAYGCVEDTEDVAAFGKVLAECFPMSFTEEASLQWPWFENPDHFRLLRHEGRIAGGLVAVPVGQWFGGRSVPQWAIRLVGVGLDYRSLGAAPVLMAAMLREARRQGVAISSLYPATQPLYRSVGYEQAGFNQLFSFSTTAARVRDHRMRVQRYDPDTGIEPLQRLYDLRARQVAGHIDRSDWFWKRILKPRFLPPPVTYLAVGDDGPEGYMVYAMASKGPSLHGYDLTVTDFVATSGSAARRMVAHLGEHHSMGKTVHLRGAPEAAALYSMPQQHIQIESSICWMLRIVDVHKALEARGYHPQVSGRLQFELHDDLLPENAGRWTLTIEAGHARVSSGGDGALRLDIKGLAPLYAGHLSPFDLTLTGLAEGSDEALQQAAHLFAGPRSWMPDFF